MKSLRRIVVFILVMTFVSGVLPTNTARAKAATKRKEISSCLSSYTKLKKKIGNITKAPIRMDPSRGKSGVLFVNKSGIYEGIMGRYNKRTKEVIMFQNTYRKKISLFGIYIGKPFSNVTARLKKSGYKFANRFTVNYNGTMEYTDTYKKGKKIMKIHSTDGGKTVTSYYYSNF